MFRSVVAIAPLLAACPLAPGDDDAADDDSAGDDDASGDDDSSCAYTDFADLVVDAPGASGVDFGDPQRAVNGVRGGGDQQGGFDVYSLGLPPSANDALSLGWSGRAVRDGDGADFVLFENAFRSGSGAFMEQAIVEVSRDGNTFVALPHDYVADDESAYSNDPADWLGFGGVATVRFHVETNCVDPFGDEAGGDRFDLASLPDDADSVAIKTFGFTVLRVTPAPASTNPDTGTAYPQDAVASGPDIDGVYARYLVTSD